MQPPSSSELVSYANEIYFQLFGTWGKAQWPPEGAGWPFRQTRPRKKWRRRRAGGDNWLRLSRYTPEALVGSVGTRMDEHLESLALRKSFDLNTGNLIKMPTALHNCALGSKTRETSGWKPGLLTTCLIQRALFSLFSWWWCFVLIREPPAYTGFPWDYVKSRNWYGERSWVFKANTSNIQLTESEPRLEEISRWIIKQNQRKYVFSHQEKGDLEIYRNSRPKFCGEMGGWGKFLKNLKNVSPQP